MNTPGDLDLEMVNRVFEVMGGTPYLRGAYARDSQGKTVDVLSPHAQTWDFTGAMIRAVESVIADHAARVDFYLRWSDVSRFLKMKQGYTLLEFDDRGKISLSEIRYYFVWIKPC